MWLPRVLRKTRRWLVACRIPWAHGGVVHTGGGDKGRRQLHSAHATAEGRASCTKKTHTETLNFMRSRFVQRPPL